MKTPPSITLSPGVVLASKKAADEGEVLWMEIIQKKTCRFRVWGLWFRVRIQGLRFRVQGSGFRVRVGFDRRSCTTSDGSQVVQDFLQQQRLRGVFAETLNPGVGLSFML